jgi:putrescine transport system ATP-binding protein
MKPSVLLLDEPMAALDRSLRADVQQELTGIQREVGTTFVLVTHDQDEAMAISDYIAVMDQGDIVQFGTPRDVYEYPRTKFVASFLGTINLFEGSLAVHAGHSQLVTEDGFEINANRETAGANREIAGANRETVSSNRETVSSNRETGGAGVPRYTVGVRPEKVCISRQPTNLPNDFAGTIERLSYCGNLSHATIRLSHRRTIEATVVNSDHTGATAFNLGDAVRAAFPAEAAVVLSA